MKNEDISVNIEEKSEKLFLTNDFMIFIFVKNICYEDNDI